MNALDNHPSDEELRCRLDADETEEDEVTRHVESCPDCQGRLMRMTALSPSRQARVRRARIQPPPPPLAEYPYEKDSRGFPIVLGQGSFGMVFLAHCRDDERRLVAVKFLQVGEDLGARERQWFVGEVLAALELDHPAIVKGIDFNAAGGRPYYVMEFVRATGGRGRNLRALQGDAPLLAGRPGRAEVIARWLRHLADGLVHAHAHYLIHRDLNPCNILVKLDESGAIETMKICDFGLARRDRMANQPAASGEELGVLPFVPPELLDKAGQASPAADIYALGAVGHYMLTGRPPFPPEAADLRDLIRSGPPAPLRRQFPDVPPDLETILLVCLRKDPRHRYASAMELKADLERFREGKRPLARRGLWLDLARRWLRKNQVAVGVVATIGLLLLAALGLLVWVRAESERANDNARHAREETCQRLLESAQAARTRGALAVAEEHYDRAAEMADPQQQRDLEIERLATLFAFGRRRRLAGELKRLAECSDLTPRQRARVLLHQGDRDLWESGEAAQKRGKERLEEALKVLGGPAEADGWYARGLLARGAVDAVRCFEEALRPGRDPFHLRANACLLMELVLSGQFDRARQQARFMAVAFPREPVVPLALATMAALEDDREGWRRHREALEKLVGRARMTGIDAAFRTIERAIMTDRGMHGDRMAWVGVLRSLAGEVFGVGGGALTGLFQPPEGFFRTEGISDVVGVGLPLLGRPVRMFHDLTRIHALLVAGRLDAAEVLLEEAMAASPEAMFRLLLCCLHALRGRDAVRRGDTEAWFAESVLIHRAAQAAATAPTLIPFGPYRRSAAWMGLAMEVGWAQTRPFVGLTAAGAVVGTGGPLLALGPLVAGQEQMRLIHRLLPEKSDGRLLQLVAAPFPRTDPGREMFLPMLAFQLSPEEANHLLTCWQRDEPRDVRPYRLLAQLALHRGDAKRALDWARRGLMVRPWDVTLGRLHAEARAGQGGRKP